MTDNDRLDELEERVSELADRFDALSQVVMANDNVLEETEDKVQRIRDVTMSELEDLRQRVVEVEDRTRMFNPPAEQSKSTEYRAALVLKNLANEAETEGIVARDYHGVIAANNGEIRRSRAMQVMREVPTLVGDDDVCYVVEESRNAEQNTRVVLDLRQGTIPATAAGVRIHDGGAAD